SRRLSRLWRRRMVARRRYFACAGRSMLSGVCTLSLAWRGYGFHSAHQQAALHVRHGRVRLYLSLAFALQRPCKGFSCATKLVPAIPCCVALYFYSGILAGSGELPGNVPAGVSPDFLLLVVDCLCLGTQPASSTDRSLATIRKFLDRKL